MRYIVFFNEIHNSWQHYASAGWKSRENARWNLLLCIMKGGQTVDSATYQTKHLSLVACGDRISLLKSELKHCVVLQKGGKALQ